MAATTIVKLLAVPVAGGYFVDDQAAIKGGAVPDGLAYPGAPVTQGFDAIRSPSSAVSVLLLLSDGYVAHGDCVGVQYGGAGGRAPCLRADVLAEALRHDLAPALHGREVAAFQSTAGVLGELEEALGTAAAYGVSQALLDASAHRAGCTMADLIKAEWGLSGDLARIPVLAQTGEARRANVDKMVLKEADSLPHGLVNDPSLVGADGKVLIDYVAWVRGRIERLRRSAAYAPVLHFDVYGLLGDVAGGDLARVADILRAMGEAARPFALRVEHPVDAGSRDGQIRDLAAIRGLLAGGSDRVEIVADEWANTVDDIHAFNRAGAADVIQIKTPDLGSVANVVDAVVDCKRHGVVAHVGGSCNETERSAQVSVHLALGAGADQMLAKPGMGVDEGLAIVRNEMMRTLALSQALGPGPASGGHS